MTDYQGDDFSRPVDDGEIHIWIDHDHSGPTLKGTSGKLAWLFGVFLFLIACMVLGKAYGAEPMVTTRERACVLKGKPVKCLVARKWRTVVANQWSVYGRVAPNEVVYGNYHRPITRQDI